MRKKGEKGNEKREWSGVICLCSWPAVGMAVVQLQRVRVADSLGKSTPANPMYQEACISTLSSFSTVNCLSSFLLPIVLSFLREGNERDWIVVLGHVPSPATALSFARK